MRVDTVERATRWTVMEPAARAAFTAPARAGQRRRFVERARAEFDAEGETPTTAQLDARVGELRSNYFRGLALGLHAARRADREELARLRRQVAEAGIAGS